MNVFLPRRNDVLGGINSSLGSYCVLAPCSAEACFKRIVPTFAYLKGVFAGSFVGIGTFCGSSLSLDHESLSSASSKNPSSWEHASAQAAQYPTYQLDLIIPGGKCTSSLLGMY